MFADFREIVLADFEFEARPGDRPVPVCLVAHELRSGRRFRIWQDQFGPAPPYATGPDVLFELRARLLRDLPTGRVIPGVESPDSLKPGFPTRARVRFPPAR